jgi:hypothetical protein
MTLWVAPSKNAKAAFSLVVPEEDGEPPEVPSYHLLPRLRVQRAVAPRAEREGIELGLGDLPTRRRF